MGTLFSRTYLQYVGLQEELTEEKLPDTFAQVFKI